ncbi:MAG: hypothetical protein EHM79_20400 [Geobacter sp.]|nr:MAG: hypothetical protein EHM79_20400 [Geobacter sp.]
MISVNSDYIVLRTDESVMLFLGDRLIWANTRFKPSIKLLTLGNNGDLIVYEEEQIFVYHQDGSREVLLETVPEARFNKVAMDGQGRLLCVESELARNPSIKKKLIFFFKSNEEEVPVHYHRIFVYDRLTREENEIWDFERDVKSESTIMWDITKDLIMLAIAESTWIEKPVVGKVTRVYLMNLREDKTLFQLNLTNVDVKGFRINEKGMLLVDMSDEGQRQFLLINQKGEKTNITPPQKNFKLLHFGTDTVIFKVLPEKVILFKDFRNNLVYVLDERILESIGLTHPIIFKSNDDIIITFFDEEKSVLKKYVYSWRGNKIDFIYHK